MGAVAVVTGDEIASGAMSIDEISDRIFELNYFELFHQFIESFMRNLGSRYWQTEMGHCDLNASVGTTIIVKVRRNLVNLHRLAKGQGEITIRIYAKD
jgi:hypothetical protein